MKSLIAVSALFTLAIMVSYAYAYEETVEIPRSDYLYQSSWTQLQPNSTEWHYTILFVFEEDRKFNLTNDWPLGIGDDPNNPNKFEDLLNLINTYLEEQIEDDGSDDVIPHTEDESPRDPLEDLDPEVREAIDVLGECAFGLEEWGAIQAQITFTVPDELPIFRHLDRDRILRDLSLQYEACRGQQDYVLGDQYKNVWLADQLGVDYLGRNQTSFGLDERRLYEEQRTASPEEIQAEADRAKFPSWVKDPYGDCMDIGDQLFVTKDGDFLTKCENRGIDTPIISDPEAYNEYIAFMAASVQTQADMDRTIARALDTFCSAYTPQYEHLVETDRYPEWLSHCQ